MKKYFKILPLVMAVLGLSSCLKDESIISSKPSNIVEFYSTSAITSDIYSIYPVYTQSFEVTPTGKFDVILSYSGTDTAPQDINIDIAVDPAAITKINEPIKKAAYDEAYAAAYKDEYDYQIDHGATDAEAKEAATAYATDEANAASDAAGYTLLPESIYKLSTTSVVIKKGQRRADPITVTVNPDQFDFALKYGLPLTIKSASFGNVSGNFSTVIYNVGAKNAYDGVYNYKTTSYQNLRGNTSEGGAELTTLDATHVSTNLVNYYSNIVVYAVDPSTNKITVTNSGGIGTPTTDPSSHWDPDTKVFYVKWSTSGGYKFEETYTYTGPRG